MTRIYLGIGSNIGDTRANVKRALSYLEEEVEIRKLSSTYETEPVGYKDQDWFLNLVLEGETKLDPQDLLDFLKSIEERMKRVKTRINGPRIIDLDILLYGDLKMDTDTLTIPHPRMLERSFVVIPLYEIAPNLSIGDTILQDYIKGFKGEAYRKSLPLG